MAAGEPIKRDEGGQAGPDSDAGADADRAQWQLWFDSTQQIAIGDALVNINKQLDQQVLEKNPTCWISGKCCHFNEYGHRLYVTGLEISWVIRQLKFGIGEAAKNADRLELTTLTNACSFQVNGMCGIHAVRPMGCRIFFCQDGTQDWQQDVYEQYQQRIRSLHDEHDLPYRYMEWRAGLIEASAAIELEG